MTKAYASALSVKATPQTRAIPGKKMSKNAAGGFAFDVDDFTRLDRFLILGTEGGTYYTNERDITLENADVVRRCLAVDGIRTLARIAEVSNQGLAPKNDPALVALAIALKQGDVETRRAAATLVPVVARTGTHLFQLAEMIEALGGWSRVTRRAIAGWYDTKAHQGGLAYQLVKYRQRNGWSHRDLIRLSHPAATPLLGWVAGKVEGGSFVENDATAIITGFEEIQAEGTDAEMAALMIRQYDLPREAVPTELLNSPEVWDALLDKMPTTALVRNLATLTRAGKLITPMVVDPRIVAALSDEQKIRKSRIHPMTMFTALKTYVSGKSVRGSNTWTPNTKVVDLLDDGFFKSFKNVEPTGKRIAVVVDESGSMGGGYYSDSIAGVPDTSPLELAAAVAMTFVHTEPNVVVFGVDTEARVYPLSKRQRLDDVVKGFNAGGGTDLAKPFELALMNNLNVDAFVIITDSETWAGRQHPQQALEEYRRKVNPNVKVAILSTTATGHSIGDPGDPNILQVVGWDSSVPQVVASFLS